MARPPSGAKLLTSIDGSFGAQCSEESRRMVAVYDSGHVFVTNAGNDNLGVAGLLDLIEKRGVKLQRPFQVADQGTILGLYHQTGTKEATPLQLAGADGETNRQLVFDVFERGRALKASDLIVRVGNDKALVLAKIDGKLQVIYDKWPVAFGEQFLRATSAWAREHGSANLSYQERKHQGGQISKDLPLGLDAVRFIKLSSGFGTQALVVRLLPTPAGGGEIYFDEHLNFPESDVRKFDRLSAMAAGIVLITGPTGSGKTHTGHALIYRRLAMFPGEHWLTVEDPIERRIPHPNVTQVDAMSRTGDDEDTAKEYNHALLAALRAAPDCLYLGEIRSTDTAEIAIRSALTGHPVYSTIHTDGAMKGVARLIDLGIDKTLLLSQSVVKGITSQRLLRELCDCGRIIRRSDWTFFCPPWLHKVFEERGAVRVANHEGCPRCNQGYRPGRQVINEIFIPSRETMRYLVEGRDDMALAAWKEQDGKPLVEIAAERVAIGVADPFDVLRSVNFD